MEEERYNKLSEAFAYFNKDNNGLITLGDVGKVMRSVGQNSTLKEQLKEAIAVLDADENFAVGFLEFFNFMAPDGGTDEELIKAFNNFGEDGDDIKSDPFLLDNETPIRVMGNVAESIVGYFPNNTDEWVVAYFPYEFPDEDAIAICSSWNVPCKFYSQVNEWLVFKLASKVDRDTVVSLRRLHQINDHDLFLEPMPVFFNLHNSKTDPCWTDPGSIIIICPRQTAAPAAEDEVDAIDGASTCTNYTAKAPYPLFNMASDKWRKDGDGDDICALEEEVICKDDAIDGASTSTFSITSLFNTDCCDEYFLEYTIIGYFLERYPVGAIDGLFDICSRRKVTSRIYFNPSGWIVFQFTDKLDRDAFLSMGPNTEVNGCPIHLLELPQRSSVEFSTIEMTKFSVWVRLPGLDIDCWTQPNTLSRIATQIGRLISIDKSTERRRLFIEVDLSNELVYVTKIKHPTKGIIMDQPVVYEEELPKFCNTCVKFGHTREGCLFQKPFIAPPVPRGVRKKGPTTLREAAEALNAEIRKQNAAANRG